MESLFAKFGNKPIRFVESEPNQRALSRNIAAAKASGQFLLFLDDDMVVKDWRIADVILSQMIVGNYDAAMPAGIMCASPCCSIRPPWTICSNAGEGAAWG